MRICEALRYAPSGNKVQKAIFSFKVKIKVTRSLTLVSFQRVSLVEYACQIWSLYLLRPLRWRRGSGLDFGLEDPVRFPTYPHRVWALWWQGGKRRLRTSHCPCCGRLGTLKTPSCPWCGCPAACQNLKTGHVSSLYSWNIAECDVKPQSTSTLSLAIQKVEVDNRQTDK